MKISTSSARSEVCDSSGAETIRERRLHFWEGKPTNMTQPLPPSNQRPAPGRPAPGARPLPGRPLEPGFLEWISRRNAPPLRQLELPVPPEIQIEDDPDYIPYPTPPRHRRR
jgi:hypothetical protein